jgi:hypothetical protein
MTPEVVEPAAKPVEIVNPYVPQEPKPAADQTASNAGQPQPLVILNPYVTTATPIAQTH